MTNQTTKTVAIVLSTIGVLLMISTAFGIFRWNIAVFAGIACFILAGMVRRIGKSEQP